MDTLERILSLIKSKYESNSAFEVALNLKPKTVDNWKRGRSQAYLKMLPKLSEVFDVSVDFLLGNTTDPTPADKKNSSLNNLKEGVRQELIRRGKITPDKELSDRDWDAILSVAETFANRSDE